MSNITDFSPVITADSFFTPAMMSYDGSTGYYSDTFNPSGNKTTTVLRFNKASFTGGIGQYILHIRSVASRDRVAIAVFASDHANANLKDRIIFLVYNSSGTIICYLATPAIYLDGNDHTIMVSFDGDAGTAQFIVDGADADDTGWASRVAPTTGTLTTTAATPITVGAYATSANNYGGSLGFVGHHEAYLTNWSDFMDGDGNPLPLDESTWTEWGGQPLFWNAYGDMENNLGSAGNMTRNGTITVGDDGTTGSSYTLTGTATPIDITAGKTAWVNGTRLDGTYEPPAPQGGRIFDDASQLYKSFTSASNKTTLFLTVTGVQSSATGRRICQVHGPSSYSILSLEVQGTGDLYPNKVYVYQTNSANAAILAAPSSDIVTDGGRYSIFISSDRDLGLYTFVINGVSLYTATNNSTGTQDLGASSFVRFGSISGAQYLRSCIGSMMVAEQYMTNWTDFMDVKGNPKTLDTSGWTEWGGTQPLVYAPNGDLDTNNLGSLGAFTWSP